jgi:hypothetical protein
MALSAICRKVSSGRARLNRNALPDRKPIEQLEFDVDDVLVARQHQAVNRSGPRRPAGAHLALDNTGHLDRFERPEDHVQTRLRNFVLGLAEAQLDTAFIGLDRVDRLHKPEADQTQGNHRPTSVASFRNRSRHRPEAPGATCPVHGGSIPQGRADCRRRVAVGAPCPTVPDCCHHHCRRRPMGRRLLRFDCSRASRPLSKPCYGTRRKLSPACAR